MLRCTQVRCVFASLQTPTEARSQQCRNNPKPCSCCCLVFLLLKVISNMHADAKIDNSIFHHVVEQVMQDEVFTGSTCSNSPVCCNTGTPWPITLLQVKSALCCTLVKEVIILQHKYLLIVIPTVVYQQFCLQEMARPLEQVMLFIIAERDGNGGCPALPC